MLLRICLIITLVGGLAATVVNFVKVKAVIIQTINEREDEKKQKVAALADASKAHKDLKTTQATLLTTQNTLKETSAKLETATATVADLTTQNGTLTSDLEKVRAARDKSDQELAKWNQLHVTPQEVIDTAAELKTTKAARDAFIAENVLLHKKVVELTNEIALLTGTDTIPPLPLGLKGTITAVDPKYGFVVLDMGADRSLLPMGLMIVARGDKFIGKIQISKVENNKSVANVIPAWSQGPVMEGDQVLSYSY